MDFTQTLEWVLTLTPSQYLGTVTALVSFLIASSALAVRFWKPPAPGSRWLIVYTVVSALAQARGWNASAYQPGRKAIMVPADMPRVEAAQKIGLPVPETSPKVKVLPAPQPQTPAK